MEIWHLWLIAAIALFIVEIYTPGFVIACFSIGCFSASIASLVGLQLNSQIAIFALTTLVVFFGVRPFFNKFAYPKKEERKTNIDALMNKIGRVTETIDPLSGTGRVTVGGEDWKAISVNDETIELDTRIEILQVDGSKLIVQEIANHTEV